MKKRESIQNIMTKDVLTLNITDSLEAAEKLMTQNKVRHLPVVSGNKLVGILSLTDLMRISFVDNFTEEDGMVDTAVYTMLSIPQVMVTNPESVTTSQTIKDVAELLATKEYHALPVVEDGELKGIVTTTDLIKYLLEQY